MAACKPEVFLGDCQEQQELAGKSCENTVQKKSNKIQKKSKNPKKSNKIQKIQKQYQSCLSILSTNAASLKHKEQDLKDKVKYFNSGIFSVQETQYRKKGKFQLDQFVIFEAIRKGKKGGGSMLGIHVGLEPVLVSEFSETFELIVVEVKVGPKGIRVITGYGPQEHWNDDDKMPFFTTLEEEIAAAELEGREVLITMDANSKLGPSHIEGDPHEMSENGKILESIINRHALVVVNGLTEKRTGIITRQRITANGKEESVIDLVLTSRNLAEHIEAIHVDERRQHVLTKNVKVGAVVKNVESDHNLVNTRLNITWRQRENQVLEVFKYKDKAAQKLFKEETTKTKELTKIVNMNKPLDVVTNKFVKRLKGFVHKCFKKVKIIDKPDEELDKLFNMRRILRNKTDTVSIAKLEELNEELANKYSDKMSKTILSEVKGITKSDEGGLNTGKLWKLKKKLMPRNQEPPTAMINKEGKLLTDKEDILKEAVEHYTNVFKDKDIVPELNGYRSEREQLCRNRLGETKQNRTCDWTVENVKDVLKSLKTGKSKDPYDIPNELLKPDVAGDDLVNGITALMNRIKNEISIPEILKVCNVTNLYKNKGERTKYDSYRGIFRTTVLRNILEKLLYKDEYNEIDQNLTDCNVGSRKGRNVRDNLFVINAIMNENKQSPQGGLDVNVYDVEKCFDSLWLSECINDLYESGMKNDHLNLLYQANQSASIAIKTACGETERINIQDTVMQGTVWGGLVCTTTMDQLCKSIYNEDSLLYKYRQSVEVPPLQMVDDIITASKCGGTSSALNAKINKFIETKKLKLSEKKCAQIHVGSKKTLEKCQENKVRNNKMKKSQKEKYLGDFITNSANAKETIKDRKRKGYGILAEITAILKDIPLGNKRTRVGLELRHAMFLNGILFNSETWTGYTKKDITMLEVLDHKILKIITGTNAKVATEMLYLETAELDIPNVLSVRRIMFWHNIVKRHKKELISKVYNAMKNKPVKGDWIHLLDEDLKSIGLSLDFEELAVQMTKQQFKEVIKSRIKQKAFKTFETMKQKHKKIANIVHNQEKIEEYLISNKFTSKTSSLLFNLRSKCVKGFKENFHGMHTEYLCPLCGKHNDSQELALTCEEVSQRLTTTEREVIYEDIFGHIDAQFKATKLFQKILQIRKDLLSSEDQDQPTGALIPDPVANVLY